MMDVASLLERLERLIDVGLALSREPDHARLMEQILLGAKALTRADGGTLYSLDGAGTQVQWEMIHTDSLGFAMGGTTGQPIPFPAIPLHDERGPNHHNVVTHAVLSRSTINIEDAYETHLQFDFSGTRAFDHRTGYRSQSFLTVPMMDHQGSVIGVLQLLNAKDENGRTVPFGLDSQRLVESLASQAAIALTNQRLIAELKTLFESFIRLVAEAIDMKSPYTGGHCRRVPVLARLLANAVNRNTQGPLGDFRMSEADLYELDVAALLHDAGKITTPEYVVDKSSKLETIFDRIELVEARFEILRRDREIAALRQALGDRSGEVPAPDTRDLRDDLDFLRRANQGGEFMTESDRQRVSTIGQPVWIDLLGCERPLLTANEIANLRIPRGTLTPEERDVINHHIVATIEMLEKLPFPKHLSRVPEFAGGHHERMDGRGYPRGLTRDQMSVQARLMAIADVFEALTARDRPYKLGKTLTESLTILGKMKLDHHIDPDLFDVFLREKVYLEYASQFLDPAQIDAVELGKIPGYAP